MQQVRLYRIKSLRKSYAHWRATGEWVGQKLIPDDVGRMLQQIDKLTKSQTRSSDGRSPHYEKPQGDSFEHLWVMEAIQRPLMVALIKRLGGIVTVPTSEIDEADGFTFSMTFNDSIFTFALCERPTVEEEPEEEDPPEVVEPPHVVDTEHLQHARQWNGPRKKK